LGPPKNDSGLRNITINIPDKYDDAIQKLIKLKITPSRSEALRTAIRDFLNGEYKNLEMVDLFLEEEI